ncbi:hypothetical protein [Paenibacillus sp. FSL M7-1046]|uniref:hypothetical protein n=1 Tax=Paenibacillus sp. FSL M7-1046 TaxID=2975315 RepID=UPI0030F57CE4
MKKYFVGFIAGIVLTLSSTVFADDISELIGKKVEGTAKVNLNGSVIGSAVIINGSTYAPIRVIGQATGLDVGYEKGVVRLNSPDISETPKKTADVLNAEIVLYQSTLQNTKEAVKKIKENIASGKYTGDELIYLQIDLERAQKMIPKDEAKIAELQAQLVELQK